MMGYGFSWILMFVGGLIVTVIIVVIIFALLRATNTSGKSESFKSHEIQNDNNSRALAILAERYAKGEINEEEYRQRKNEITKT